MSEIQIEAYGTSIWSGEAFGRRMKNTRFVGSRWMRVVPPNPFLRDKLDNPRGLKWIVESYFVDDDRGLGLTRLWVVSDLSTWIAVREETPMSPWGEHWHLFAIDALDQRRRHGRLEAHDWRQLGMLSAGDADRMDRENLAYLKCKNEQSPGMRARGVKPRLQLVVGGAGGAST